MSTATRTKHELDVIHGDGESEPSSIHHLHRIPRDRSPPAKDRHSSARTGSPARSHANIDTDGATGMADTPSTTSTTSTASTVSTDTNISTNSASYTPPLTLLQDIAAHLESSRENIQSYFEQARRKSCDLSPNSTRSSSLTYEDCSELKSDAESKAAAASAAATASAAASAADDKQESDPKDDYFHLPLSLRFLTKPSRAKEMLDVACDPTRHNSIINATIANTYVSSEDPSPLSSPKLQAYSPPTPPPNADPETSPQFGYTLVRKKSGEILKPSLKDRSFFFKGSKSLPTTPTYKQVHFGCSNDVRYFKKKDMPAAISASNSPTLESTDPKRTFMLHDEDDDYNEDDYDDYGNSSQNNQDENDNDYDSDDSLADELECEDQDPHKPFAQTSTTAWQLQLGNFAPLSYRRKIVDEQSPVFLERMFIDMEQKHLVGQIAVKNLAYEKALSVRYSLDNWLTIVEIPTVHTPERPDILKQHDYDRFTFSIPLGSLFSYSGETEHKEYQLCIKYSTPEAVHWDNNGSRNYSVKLTKTVKKPPMGAKGSTQMIKTHTARPKYSSSYLKRRVSDSNIEMKKQEPENSTANGASNTPFYTHDNTSNETSDFVKNNYYMSSPLFSSLQGPAKAQVIRPKLTHSPKIAPDSNNQQEQKPVETKKENKKEKQASPTKDRFLGRSFMNTTSYKELLDKYCFGGTGDSKLDENNDEANRLSPTSENPKVPSHQNNSSKEKGSKAPFAVSSFLGS